MASKALLLHIPVFRGIRNGLGGGALLKRLPFSALGLGFWFVLYLGAHWLVSYAVGIEYFGVVLVRRLLGLMLFGLIGFMVVSNLVTGITAFYLSRDLQLLRTLPVSDADILKLKASQCIVSSSWMVASFVPPILVAFGTATSAPWQYYAVVMAAFFFYMLIAAGVGIILAHALTRLFPAGRVRDVMIVGGIVLFMLFYFLFRTYVPEGIEDPLVFIDTLTALRLETPFMPSFWVLQAASPYLAGGQGDMFYLFVLAANAAFFLLLAQMTGRVMLRGNLERIVPSRGSRVESRGGWYPGGSMSMLYKDTKMFVRDKAQWSQLLIILALAFVYVYNFKLVPAEAILSVVPYAREVVVVTNVLLAGLVLGAVAARFVYTSVSLEGQAFWVVKSAPIGLRRFLRYKFVMGAVPVTSLILAMVVLTNASLGIGGMLMVLSAATVVLLGVSICALGIGMGAMNPRFRYEHIATVSMSLGGMTFMLLALVLTVVTIGLEAWALFMYATSGGLHLQSLAASVLLIITINVLAAVVPMRLGYRNLMYNSVP